MGGRRPSVTGGFRVKSNIENHSGLRKATARTGAFIPTLSTETRG